MAIVYEKPEAEEDWIYIGLNRYQFYKHIYSYMIVGTMVEAYQKKDKRKWNKAALIER